MQSNPRSPTSLPPIAALGLVMAGLGLLGMTAGDLPGIAEQVAAPRCLMGALGGLLVGSGLHAGRVAPDATAKRPSHWVVLVGFSVVGIVLARLSDLTRSELGQGLALPLGAAVNAAARVLFGIGIGIVLGWVAYEGSGGRKRP